MTSEPPVRPIALAVSVYINSPALKISRNKGFDLHVVEEFFDRSTCRRLVAEIRLGETSAALTYGKGVSGVVDERTRKVSRAAVSSALMTEVTTRLVEFLPR